jgi:hypothetical protein
VTVPVKPQERKLRVAGKGQNARPSQKHCKACAKHAHAWYIGARARLYARVCTVSILVEISTKKKDKRCGLKVWCVLKIEEGNNSYQLIFYPLILPEFTRPILIVPTYLTFVCTTPTTWHYF